MFKTYLVFFKQKCWTNLYKMDLRHVGTMHIFKINSRKINLFLDKYFLRQKYANEKK